MFSVSWTDKWLYAIYDYTASQLLLKSKTVAEDLRFEQCVKEMVLLCLHVFPAICRLGIQDVISWTSTHRLLDNGNNLGSFILNLVNHTKTRNEPDI